MKTRIKDRIKGALALTISTAAVCAVLLAPTNAEAWHVTVYLFVPILFPIPIITWS